MCLSEDYSCGEGPSLCSSRYYVHVVSPTITAECPIFLICRRGVIVPPIRWADLASEHLAFGLISANRSSYKGTNHFGKKNPMKGAGMSVPCLF